MTVTVAQMRDRPRLNPVYLVELLLQGAGAPTLYFSDRNITVSSQIYENYLAELSGLAEEIERATSRGMNPDISLKFNNDKYKAYNYLIEIGDTYPWEGAVCTIKEAYLDDSGAYTVNETLFKGALDEPANIDLMSFDCSVSSMVFVKDQQWSQLLITKAIYANADPDDLNKMQNIIYGSCENVRCHAIKAGAVDSLTANITAASPGNSGSLTLSDASEFPAAGAFTIQVELEQIRIASRSGNVLTLASSGARGYNSTTAAEHVKGIGCFEVLTEYIYLIAGHPVKAINNVYVDGVRQVSGFTPYTGQSGDELTDYEGKAVIKFTAKPTVSKQINVSASLSGSVTDNIGYSSNSLITCYFMEQYTINSGSWSLGAQYACNNNFNDGGVSQVSNTNFQIITPKNPGGNPSRIRIGINHSDNIYDNIASVDFFLNGSFLETISLNGAASKTTNFSSWYTLSSFTHINASSTYINIVCTSGHALRVWEAWFEVEHTPTLTKSGGASNGTLAVSGGASSADVVIGDSITVDVDGYRDDGSGTYTGSANALIERPDHVLKHFIDILYGFVLADDIDSSSFSAAGTLYAAAISGGYKLAFALTEGIKPSELLADLAAQSHSNIRYHKGKWYLDYLPDTAPTPVKTISQSDLAGQYAKFIFHRSASVDIANDLIAKFKKNYGPLKFDESEWQGTSTASDSTSQGKYGVRQKTYEFSAVRLQAMADHVLLWLKLQKKNPLLIVEFPVFWEHFDLERGDTIDIDNPLYDAKRFYIEKVSRRDKGVVEITGIEWPA